MFEGYTCTIHFAVQVHYVNIPRCSMQGFLKALKMMILRKKKEEDIFLIFALKHRLWVQVRATSLRWNEAVLKSTNTLRFRAK